MNQFQQTLYDNLMTLCQSGNEAFYFVDHTVTDSLGDLHFRVFTYRLASYSDFLLPGALECRGHTFMLSEDKSRMVGLVSMPMQKFFNLGENPLTMGLDLSKVCRIMDKLDGSLISTVIVGPIGTEYLVKSKTSFSSDQAKAATKLLDTDEYFLMDEFIKDVTQQGYTVNMEYLAPDNRIVIGYEKPMLRILNVRSTIDGSYMSYDDIAMRVPEDQIVQCHDIPADPAAFVESISGMTGIEGYILELEGGQLVKIKTDAYCLLHKTKDSISTPRKLFEACVYEQSDDLRALFVGDIGAQNLISEMEKKAASIYNHIHKVTTEFYEANKELSRKEFAIKGQAELATEGLFTPVMQMYLGSWSNSHLKEFIVKNYKKYGITDDPDVEVGE